MIKSVNPGPLDRFMRNFRGVVFDQVMLLSEFIGDVSIFDRLKGPLLINVLKELVYRVIEELKTGFAPMDLRAPHICYLCSKEEMKAVLIDLVNVTTKPQLDGNSVMCNVEFSEAKMYDWSQYAIMLASIMSMAAILQCHNFLPALSGMF